MVGPRLTAPVSKIARSISTSASASVPKSASGTIITSSKAAAPLSRKYADLLKERNVEWDVSLLLARSCRFHIGYERA